MIKEERFGLPAVNIQADFFRPIRFGDEPDISLAVLRLGTSSVQLGFWMTDSDIVACRARITTVAVDMDTMQKQTIPDHWRRKFTEFEIAEESFPAGPS